MLRMSTRYAKLIGKTFTPKTQILMTNQRTSEVKTFKNGEVKLQVEGATDYAVMVRGKYPNDDWFGKCKLDELSEV